MRRCVSAVLVSSLLLSPAVGLAGTQCDAPSDIQAVFSKTFYKGALWGLRVIDLETGQPLVDLEPEHPFFIGSVRKIFTVGELLNQVGPGYRYNTPVYRQGTVSDGTLRGDLILQASGDLTMGGRTLPDGRVAYTAFDHNEANSLGNAILTKPDPLAGYAALAQQIAASGIKEITGDVVIDDRLFKPFEFREEFDVKPIFVNDDVVDLSIDPTSLGELASLRHRPHSAALGVNNAVTMTAGGEGQMAEIKPSLPSCIGTPDCVVTLKGDLPVGYVPMLTMQYPLIRTFRIVDPSSYARTVLIEKLRDAGVKVSAALVEPNPTQLLPAKNSYQPDMLVTELTGLPYSEDAKLVNKVSYNIGADTSLVLWGLTQGVDNLDAALLAEQKNLQANYGIEPSEYHFIDGSGAQGTTATNGAVTHLLADMYARPSYPDYLASLPILGVDGSLATVTDFECDKSLAPAKGQVHAKTGTYIDIVGDDKLIIQAQAFGGYINAKSGRKLAYQLVVNGVPYTGLEDVIQIFQDEGAISAILWRDN